MRINDAKSIQLRKEFEYLIGDSKFNDLIKYQLDYIFKECGELFSIKLISSKKAADEEDVYKRAKIIWEKQNGNSKKVALSIVIDCVNLTKLDLLFAFLHEFGHLMDLNNIDIQFETKRSEVSAWKNAYNVFKLYVEDIELENNFIIYATKCLNSYDLSINSFFDLIEYDLIEYDLMRIID